MTKRILCFLLCAFMLIFMVACNRGGDNGETSVTTEETNPTVTTGTETAGTTTAEPSDSTTANTPVEKPNDGGSTEEPSTTTTTAVQTTEPEQTTTSTGTKVPIDKEGYTPLY